ncbi:U3 small nucleolar RNA-associated protein 15 homolog [Culicoides brevitarsis]|uniref:U3 small nucleolar RNA-associated protein 15 homolog n=1 Tax=Culicoides brevitarsis TaxID=469753 RepID=UPI00307BDD4D
MNSFKRTNVQTFNKTAVPVTPDSIYWKKLGKPYHIKEFGGIDYIDFCHSEQNYFAVSCSVRVQVYNPTTKLVIKNFSKFQQQAYGGNFRYDDRLLVAGDEESTVRLFDVSSKNILRLFKGHKAPVHRTFFASDTTIASYSDDKTVKVWDIPSEKALNTFAEHSDYIRAGCVSPVSLNLILSGGYDKIVKMYDTRTANSVMEVMHGSPVESMLMLPTGGIFITAGGTEIKVWDALGGGKLLASINQHHKTVTCLRMASKGKRLVSASLDKHCKIYDIATYQVVHSIDFPNSILSLGLAKNDKVLAGGMVDGTVSVFRMDDTENDESNIKFTQQQRRFDVLDKVDEVIKDHVKNAEPQYDKYLRKYNYSAALEFALRPHLTNKTPHVSVAIIRELIHRKGLQRALMGRTQNVLARYLNFIKKYFNDYRFNRTLLDAATTFMQVYEHSIYSMSSDVQQHFIALKDRIQEEEKLSLEFMELRGVMELLFSASNVESIDSVKAQNYSNLQTASEDAKRKSIISVE